MDINLTLKDETIVLPQDLTIKRWDWLVSNLSVMNLVKYL